MKIAAAGGLGFEQELAAALQGHSITLVGSSYDLKKERFQVPEGLPDLSFTGEYLTHNYSQILSEHDLLIDISGNMKSVFIMNDAAVKFGRKFVAVFFSDGWKIVSFDPKSGSGCLNCLTEYAKPQPPFSLPEIPRDQALAGVLAAVRSNEAGYISDLAGGRTAVKKKEPCATESGSYRFLNGEMADITAVSCSDHSVAITPLNDMPVDLPSYRKLLEPAAKIVKESQFFVQFKLLKYDCTIFRLGRMVVKGTKEKNTGFFIYRNYLGT